MFVLHPARSLSLSLLICVSILVFEIHSHLRFCRILLPQYNTGPISYSLPLKRTKSEVKDTYIYSFSSSSFFPIDKAGVGWPERMNGHNVSCFSSAFLRCIVFLPRAQCKCTVSFGLRECLTFDPFLLVFFLMTVPLHTALPLSRDQVPWRREVQFQR